MDEEKPAASLELVERRRDSIQVEQLTGRETGSCETVSPAPGSKRHEPSGGRRELQHPVLVCADELVTLGVGELLDTQRRLQRDHRDVDLEAVEQGEPRIEIVGPQIDLRLMLLGKDERRAPQAWRMPSS